MKIFPGMLLVRARCLLLAAIFITAPLAVAGGGARAQSVDLSTDQVTVDLSVIEGSGTGPAAAPYMTRPQGLAPRLGLLLPGNKNPVSRLHVAVPQGTGRIKLKRPGSKVKKTPRRMARKKPPAKKPEIKKPEPPKVAASKPPEPLITAPAPSASPASKTAVAKAIPKPASKPPASKPVEKAAAKPSPPSKPAPQQQAKAAPPKAPVVAAQPKPESKAKEQAAVAPAPKETKTGPAMRVAFGATASKLPAAAKNDLKALAKKLKGKDNLRLQLMAYAGGKSLSSSKARRLSLSRALSVRSFLIKNGVRSTLIDVRALGSKTTEKPLNRVDVNIVER